MIDQPTPEKSPADRSNPLLSPEINPAVNLHELEAPNIHRRERNTHKRDLRDARRIKSAAEAITGFSKTREVYGFTKGQFSVIDLVREVLEYTGPAELVITTWTAGRFDVGAIIAFCESKQITKCRWLVDDSLQRRYPELAHRIRHIFGPDAIRVASNHAKFYLVGNSEWKVVIHGSMNLNYNAKFENFTVLHDPDFYDFHHNIIGEIWARQSVAIAEKTCYEVHKFWRANH